MRAAKRGIWSRAPTNHMHLNGTLERRGPGRPKGLGRVPDSGRKPGTPNRTTAELREQITAAALDHARSRSSRTLRLKL